MSARVMSQRTFLAALSLAAIVIGPACGTSSTEETTVPRAEAKATWPHLTCDPIVPSYCGFPFPSNVFTVDAPETPTGRRVRIDDATLPVALNGGKSNGEPWSKSDGFSSGATMLLQLPGAPTTAGLPTLTSLDRSLAADSPTIIIEADTGTRIPHFAEIDITRGDLDHKTFMIHPVVPLADGKRYIVAVRRVKDASGADIDASPAFRALRDSKRSDEPSVDQRRGLYEDIFDRLAKANVDRASLQLAWDFTTASRENVTGWLLHMRDEALERAGENGPAYVIDSVDENSDPRIAYRIKGHFTAPLYVHDPAPGSRLLFGADGMPEPDPARPTYEVPFEAMIPKSALTKPAALLQYGHGLLGSSGQIGAENFKKLANDKNYVIFGIDLIGMSSDDRTPISNVISSGHIHEISTMFDRLHQGMLNSVLAMRMMSRGFAKDPKFGAFVDPTQRYYHGISQGGIMGGVYMALSTDVTRGVLSVMGQPYTLLLQRSVDFAPFFLVMRGAYVDLRDQQLFLQLVQMLWDRVEPSGWTKYLRGGLPNTPAHEVLMRAAPGDHQVATWGAHVFARAVGAKHLDSGVRDVFGLEKTGETSGGSVYTEYDFGLPQEPTCNVPMIHCDDPHGLPRKLQVAEDQLDRFLRSGEGVNYCENKICKFPEQSGCPGGQLSDLCVE